MPVPKSTSRSTRVREWLFTTKTVATMLFSRDLLIILHDLDAL